MIKLQESTVLIIFVLLLVLYYVQNSVSGPKKVIRRYVKRRPGQIVGDHGGLLVSSPEINIRTRGPEMNYQQQGILYKEDGGVLGLYGRQKYPGSSQWEYMVGDKSLDNIKIPVDTNNKELDNDDTVDVKGFGSDYKVQLYDNEELRYLPF